MTPTSHSRELPPTPEPGDLVAQPQAHVDRPAEVVCAVLLTAFFTGLAGLAGAGRGVMLAAAVAAGCAWSLVCAVLYARRVSLFQLWRRRWLARLRSARSPEALRATLAEGLPASLVHALEPQELARLQGIARSEERDAAVDYKGALGVAVLSFMAPLPILWPLLWVPDAALALRLLHGTAAVWLFLLGAWWARRCGLPPWLAGATLAVLAGLLGTASVWLRG